MSAAELRTLVISDLVDSTALVDRLGDVSAAALFGEHDRLARGLLERFGGREIDKADGLLALFDRPLNALHFALDYQKALADLSASRGFAVEARVGVHLGEVVLRQNEPEQIARGAKALEVEGLAKPLAARLMSLARGRQILLSRTACEVTRRSAVGTELDGDAVVWRSHGEYRLKGVTEPVEVWEVGLPGLAAFTAPSDSEKGRRAGQQVRPGILVLPFADHSPDADSGHIGDGLADEIISALSGASALRVISRSAAMQLRGTMKSSKTLGAELNVQYVLQGSVQRSGAALRIRAQLVQAESDEVLWADRVGGALADLFDIQERITRSVAQALQVRLTEHDEQRIVLKPIPNVAAYDYYLRAKQLVYSFTGEALDRALEYLQKGLAVLGDNIPLQAATGYVYWQYFNAGVHPDPEYLDKARACAQRIFALDPASPDGHRLLGLIEIHAKGDTQSVAQHLKLALSADPNDTDSLFWLSLVYGFAGHTAAAYPLIDRLLEIDPLTPFPHVMPGYLALLDGDFERALPQLLSARALDPANPIVTLACIQVLAMMSRVHEANVLCGELERDAPGTFFARVGRCYVHALRGEREAALALITSDVKDAAMADLQYAWVIAQCYAVVGETELGIEWVRKATRFGNLNYPLLSHGDPMLASLRDQAEFADLMHEVKARWQVFRT